ncbi:MAG: cytochrome P450, partial [Candidatus Binatia bacterium]
LVLFGSANRDEAKFVEPQRFDVTRSNAQENLAFGYGIHFCLGAPLARLESLVALEALVPHLAHLSWQEAQLKRSTVIHQIRGLASFPVTVRGW